LGERCGITASYLSSLERGRSSPTLATLTRILHALGSDLESFFSEGGAHHASGPVYRRSDMRSASDSRRRYTFALPRREGIKIQLLDEYIAAGEEAPEFEVLGCDVSGVLLSGTLELEIDGQTPIVLYPGDAFYIPENTRHRGRCLGSEPAHLITVYVPPKY
jgi:transcriptional regulator with XRE-family HTH domain